MNQLYLNKILSILRDGLCNARARKKPKSTHGRMHNHIYTEAAITIMPTITDPNAHKKNNKQTVTDILGALNILGERTEALPMRYFTLDIR